MQNRTNAISANVGTVAPEQMESPEEQAQDVGQELPQEAT